MDFPYRTKSMPINKRLVILVEDFPTGMGEPFLANELPLLIPYFSEIIILSRTFSSGNKNKHLFSLPEGVRVIYFKSVTRTAYLLSLGKALFSMFKNECRDLKLEGQQFSWIGIKTAFKYRLSAKGIARQCIRVVIQEKFYTKDTLWYSYWWDSGALALHFLAQKGLISKWVSRAHGADLYAERHPKNYLPFRAEMLGSVSRIYTISHQGRTYLWKKYPKYSNKISLARLGVACTESIVSSENKIVFVSISSLLPVKRLEWMAKVFQNWKGPEIEWHHIGDSPPSAYRSNLISMIEQSASESTSVVWKFHGFKEPATIYDVLRKIAPNALVNCSKFEGLPVSMMESMALGIPVIGPEIGGVPEIVSEGENGFLYKSNDFDSFFACINRFCKLSIESRNALAIKALETQRTFFSTEKNATAFAIDLVGGAKPQQLSHSFKNLKRKPNIGILDYGVGNVHSVKNMLDKAGWFPELLTCPQRLSEFSTLLIPGVGSFDAAMQRLNEGNWTKSLQEYYKKGGELIGICLGMQLLCRSSEEGHTAGLGVFGGCVKRFPIEHQGDLLKIPHMGWRNVSPGLGFQQIEDAEVNHRFYFTHSYYVVPDVAEEVFFVANHGIDFTAAIRAERIWGFQFHPEKSHVHGIDLFRWLAKQKKMN